MGSGGVLAECESPRDLRLKDFFSPRLMDKWKNQQEARSARSSLVASYFANFVINKATVIASANVSLTHSSLFFLPTFAQQISPRYIRHMRVHQHDVRDETPKSGCELILFIFQATSNPSIWQIKFLGKLSNHFVVKFPLRARVFSVSI
jgi:hypothetical protein